MKKLIAIILTTILIFCLSCCNKNGANSSSINEGETLNLEAEGFNEIIVASVDKKPNASYEFYYKKDDEEYQLVDSNLVLERTDKISCEILGLEAGSYSVKVKESLNGKLLEKEISNVTVSALDRSGYAHFNSQEGVGAYNNDGTLKENTQIIWLTNENKNTVTATFSGKTYVGIVNVLSNLRYAQNPVVIRVKGKVTTNQWNYKEVVSRLSDNSNLSPTHFDNTFSTAYGENIVNLEVKLIDKKDGKIYKYLTTKDGILPNGEGVTDTATVIYKRTKHPELYGREVYHDDCSSNLIRVKGAKNVTLEGVFEDAEIFQWGVSFNDCASIEVRNLTFTNYTEDAIGFYSNTMLEENSRFWAHHNRFNAGKNDWDLTGEQDKYAGDGAIDINEVSFVTVSYNEFFNCNKTGLVSSSAENCSKNITFHHNYYSGISSRLPLARNANIHVYNNFYYNCSSCLNIRVGAFVFSENNVFSNSKKCHTAEDGGEIKSYNDVFSSSSGISSVRVSKRGQKVTNSCSLGGVDYSSFDTNPLIFYYDIDSGKTSVSIMNSPLEVEEFVKKFAGIKGKYVRLI